jgi:release factor glutamine methyltransferase
MSLSVAIDLAATVFAEWSETSCLDAGTLLAFVLSKPRTWILAHPETQLNDGQCEALHSALSDASTGMPLPYIIGHWEFYGLDFIVTRDVLIPRPETELLVDKGLEWLSNHSGRLLASDIGTGSGCIAISLVVNQPELKVYACDISEKAIQVAFRNARKHGVEDRVHLMTGDLLGALPEPVDMVCANLPYIPSAKLDGLRVAQQEPRLALDGGPEGLDLIRRLMVQCSEKVKPGGLILLEIEAGQGSQVIHMANSILSTPEVRCHQDLAGMDRLISIVLSNGSDTINAS